MSTATNLEQHLVAWADRDPAREVIGLLVTEIANAGVRLAQSIARFDLRSFDMDTGTVGYPALSGMMRHPLMFLAHEIFESTARALPVSAMVSAHTELPLALDREAEYAIVIDPLDGFSNIETNLSIGSIFAILESRGDDIEGIQPGTKMKAAGFLFYGPQTRLVLTCGAGTYHFLLDPSSERFYRVGGALAIPAGKREFAINTSNYRYWERPVRHFIDDCIAGEEGVLGGNFNMRWNASLVAEAFRILTRGGIFLYPRDSRPECRDGRLRLLHEALPLAMLVEQAGGIASDGSQPIMQTVLETLQDRVPLIFGDRDGVVEVIDYISGSALDSSHFPLFAQRSLLSN